MARLEERTGELWEAARLEGLTVYKSNVAKKTKAGIGEVHLLVWSRRWI